MLHHETEHARQPIRSSVKLNIYILDCGFSSHALIGSNGLSQAAFEVVSKSLSTSRVFNLASLVSCCSRFALGGSGNGRPLVG